MSTKQKTNWRVVMMMTTKAGFKRFFEENKTVYYQYKELHEFFDKDRNKIHDFSQATPIEKRQVKRVYTNSIKFNNDSSIYFDSIGSELITDDEKAIFKSSYESIIPLARLGEINYDNVTRKVTKILTYSNSGE